jgi:hypothetical protein
VIQRGYVYMMRHRASKFVAGGLLSLGLILGLTGTAFAYAPVTTLNNPPTCVVGDCSITVNGVGFLPGETVDLSYADPISLGTTVANAQGNFAQPVTFPASIPAGTVITITGTGVTSGRVATSTVTVVGAAAPVQATTAALAFTGADLSFLIATASIAIAVGGILVLSSRRKVRTNK